MNAAWWAVFCWVCQLLQLLLTQGHEVTRSQTWCITWFAGHMVCKTVVYVCNFNEICPSPLHGRGVLCAPCMYMYVNLNVNVCIRTGLSQLQETGTTRPGANTDCTSSRPSPSRLPLSVDVPGIPDCTPKPDMGRRVARQGARVTSRYFT